MNKETLSNHIFRQKHGASIDIIKMVLAVIFSVAILFVIFWLGLNTKPMEEDCFNGRNYICYDKFEPEI